MSVEEIKANRRRFVEEINKGKAAYLAVADEIFTTDVVVHTARGEDVHGLENVKQAMSKFYDAFPDFQATIEDIIVEGDKVAVRLTWTCTHKGKWRGAPPTNKTVTNWAIQIDRVVGGKVAERWARNNTLGFQQQLGLIPTPKTET